MHEAQASHAKAMVAMRPLAHYIGRIPHHGGAGRMEAPMTKQQTATAAFIARKAEIDAMISLLARMSDEHFGVGPDDVNWGHVGSLSEVARKLREIIDFVA